MVLSNFPPWDATLNDSHEGAGIFYSRLRNSDGSKAPGPDEPLHGKLDGHGRGQRGHQKNSFRWDQLEKSTRSEIVDAGHFYNLCRKYGYALMRYIQSLKIQRDWEQVSSCRGVEGVGGEVGWGME